MRVMLPEQQPIMETNNNPLAMHPSTFVISIPNPLTLYFLWHSSWPHHMFHILGEVGLLGEYYLLRPIYVPYVHTDCPARTHSLSDAHSIGQVSCLAL